MFIYPILPNICQGKQFSIAQTNINHYSLIYIELDLEFRYTIIQVLINKTCTINYRLTSIKPLI